MAYLAWLCKEYMYDGDDEVDWVVKFNEPDHFAYAEVIPVSLTELKDFNERN